MQAAKTKATKAGATSSGGKAAKKKKWSKGKVKDKASHAVSLDKALYDRIMKEVPTFRFISQSILIERLKINGSLARVAIRHLEKDGQIKRIVHHSRQLIYSASPFHFSIDRWFFVLTELPFVFFAPFLIFHCAYECIIARSSGGGAE